MERMDTTSGDHRLTDNRRGRAKLIYYQCLVAIEGKVSGKDVKFWNQVEGRGPISSNLFIG